MNTQHSLSCEALESRRMLSVSAYTYGGTLFVEGDDADNVVQITMDQGVVMVDVPSESASYHFSADNVWDIVVRAGAGDDSVIIHDGVFKPAVVWGGPGADYLKGGGGQTDLWGHGAGSGIYSPNRDDNAGDMLTSGRGATAMFGQGGNDKLFTDTNIVSGQDLMDGGDGNDTFWVRGHGGLAGVYGGAGNDALVPSQTATQKIVFNGGSGAQDRVDYRGWTASVFVVPDGVTSSGLRWSERLHTIHWSVEFVEGTDHDDYFMGTSLPNSFYGWGGNDTIHGMGGNDFLLGGDGNDYIYGGSGDDTIYGGAGDDHIWGDAGHDKIYGNGGADQLRGGSGNDQIYGHAGNDLLWGDGGYDLLVGGAGADYLNACDGLFGDVVFGDNIDGTGGGAGDDIVLVDFKISTSQMDVFAGAEILQFWYH